MESETVSGPARGPSSPNPVLEVRLVQPIRKGRNGPGPGDPATPSYHKVLPHPPWTGSGRRPLDDPDRNFLGVHVSGHGECRWSFTRALQSRVLKDPPLEWVPRGSKVRSYSPSPSSLVAEE